MLQNITKCTALRDGDRNFKKELAECKSELAKFKVENSNLILEISKIKAEKSDRNFRRELAQCKKISFQKDTEIRELNVKLNIAFQENKDLLEANNSKIERIENVEKQVGELEQIIRIGIEENSQLKKQLSKMNDEINNMKIERNKNSFKVPNTAYVRHLSNDQNACQKCDVATDRVSRRNCKWT